ncbi:glycosyltransferase family 4 protein [Rhodovarius lipocyclicus]|uniref:glycosyltransferase family 4 protein n=1 Tax=Rhodovarius lipocyclicus TaxID=268410 RepID=UPI001357C626|nr:glycosyltransferase family 4 protein [Rhodovarius lipocyclicus]
MSLSPPNAALAFMPEGYTTRSGRLMGRQSATEGMLRALIRHGGLDALHAYTLAPGQEAGFAAIAGELGATQPCHAIPPGGFGAVARLGTLCLPGPDLGGLAAQRALARQDRGFSLVGVTHTLSSLRAMQGITQLLTAPLHPWDAVVCTSRAARAMVAALLEAEQARLAERLGATRFPRPALPLIPLGIETGDFHFPPAMRAEWRARIGAAEEDFVVLSHGRVSWHAKAHPWPMLAALGRLAARHPGRRIHVLVVGWTSHPAQETALAEQARALCPTVRLHRAGGAEPERRPGSWAAADAFILLSDNIQETFGLAVIEAMAAGLPVIVSDWDGFKDTVRDGQDGFRIPTLMAPPGTAGDLALAHATAAVDYDHHLAATTQLVAVDIAAAAQALETLLTDPARARAMGQAARLRAGAEYDWSVLIPRHQALWRELAAIRQAAAPPARLPAPAPELADPTQAFQSWPSAHLTATTPLARDPEAPALLLDQALALPAAIHPRPDAARLAQLAHLLAAVPEHGSITAGKLREALPPAEQPWAGRGILWLLKTGYLRAG